MPISHAGRYKVSEHILNNTNHAFCFTISLGVKRYGLVPCGAQALRENLVVHAGNCQPLSEMTSKARP